MSELHIVRTEMRDKCLLALNYYLLGDITEDELNQCIERYSDACDTVLDLRREDEGTCNN